MEVVNNSLKTKSYSSHEHSPPIYTGGSSYSERIREMFEQHRNVGLLRETVNKRKRFVEKRGSKEIQGIQFGNILDYIVSIQNKVTTENFEGYAKEFVEFMRCGFLGKARARAITIDTKCMHGKCQPVKNATEINRPI